MREGLPDRKPGDRVVERRPPLGRAARAGAWIAGLAALGCVVWAYLEYAGRARSPILSIAFAGACFASACAVLLGFRTSYPFETRTAPRHLLIPESLPPVPPIAPADHSLRRRFLALMGAAGTALVAALLLPLRSLGTWPREVLFATAWSRGVRLLTLEGIPVRPEELPPGSATPVVPASSPGDPSSMAVVVCPRGAATGLGALRAFSRICTHAGCAVSMYVAETDQLVCPCHRSVFAAADGQVLAGPAGAPLPRLRLALDPEGYVVAAGTYDRAIGPPMGRNAGARAARTVCG